MMEYRFTVYEDGTLTNDDDLGLDRMCQLAGVLHEGRLVYTSDPNSLLLVRATMKEARYVLGHVYTIA